MATTLDSTTGLDPAELDRLPAPARLQRCAAEVARLRAAGAADPARAARIAALKRWQAARLAQTHADLLADPGHASGARFFLEELYGGHDFSQRDAELARVLPMLSRLLPAGGLATLADAVELDALSERLDQAMADSLGEADAARIDAKRYAASFRAVGTRADRERQVALVERAGASLRKLVRHPLLGRLLSAMESPARLAGLAQMHQFLVRGHAAFRGLDDADAFVATIVARERALIATIAAGGEPPALDLPQGRAVS